MLRSLNQLHGYSVHATDGDIGKVCEFYFDDIRWGIRYLVVSLGRWLPGRKVLISPTALGEPDWEKRILPVSITKAQVESSPDVDTDMPVARQHEAELHRHYGWELYWSAEALAGAPFVGPLDDPASSPPETVNKGGKPFDAHLRTTRVITGFHIEAVDGVIGHVADFIVDDACWCIRYLVVDTRSWIPGRQVLVAPEWVERVSWETSTVYLDNTRKEVKNCPEFTPSSPVNRRYEECLYDYYGRPKYWRDGLTF
ncbi:MAG: hypothetical protein A3K19_30100 [Lentisphaerae bacterium RIFOXYB12_FULL_65_16]|nr:MAG: hypothetical protein A3K18_18905 [Lentisphaerae bacterium RIFOXYA12_64_32]OGV85765.1 MAG: hypothetical protein A3K19_30100 [Lentisphaerae bacterium RIFOXYB12_FULL_65_16]